MGMLYFFFFLILSFFFFLLFYLSFFFSLSPLLQDLAELISSNNFRGSVILVDIFK